MRVHASGIGATLEAALVRVAEQLKTAARQHHEVKMRVAEGNKIEPDPASGTMDNPHRDLMLAAAQQLGNLVSLPLDKEGRTLPNYQYRVLVMSSDDGGDAHVRVDIDLIRG